MAAIHVHLRQDCGESGEKVATVPCEFHGIVVAVAIVAITVRRFAVRVGQGQTRRFPRWTVADHQESRRPGASRIRRTAMNSRNSVQLRWAAEMATFFLLANETATKKQKTRCPDYQVIVIVPFEKSDVQVFCSCEGTVCNESHPKFLGVPESLPYTAFFGRICPIR
ncbi:hypothetical protein Pan14r_26130 [Crateriforma conspicua]|uniref:Uncharacterized protein n=1 Tax=Crateriforma conspicua TaxID=2527996 RepID=A0A5C5Y5V5_9PLAN|nr:hypothetical protein Pan14r_26130 [Crateriforma conspicua]